FEETLDEAEQERWQALRVARLLDGEGGALSVDAYFAEIDTLAQDLDEGGDERTEELLGALHDYAEMVVPEAG
ncbi:MAG: exodeoxyribonuclease I, partial [Comamonadaceae bacterium]